jgi:hypothetical protein
MYIAEALSTHIKWILISEYCWSAISINMQYGNMWRDCLELDAYRLNNSNENKKETKNWSAMRTSRKKMRT